MRAATLVVLASHNILRTAEFSGVIALDIHEEAGGLLIVLRDTFVLQRLGINQEILVQS